MSKWSSIAENFSKNVIEYKNHWKCLETMILIQQRENISYSPPTNVKGTETPNQRASKAMSVENGTAALLPFPQSIKFMMKKSPNTKLYR